SASGAGGPPVPASGGLRVLRNATRLPSGENLGALLLSVPRVRLTSKSSVRLLSTRFRDALAFFLVHMRPDPDHQPLEISTWLARSASRISSTDHFSANAASDCKKMASTQYENFTEYSHVMQNTQYQRITRAAWKPTPAHK